ncbi:MAG: right-handed parallel beta-helix repeat-containing protein, partial [Thermoplasmata archaeon]|nr:right-handed parallel beta-helix repeat-containing protein [Thermoplasmata archaeon]
MHISRNWLKNRIIIIVITTVLIISGLPFVFDLGSEDSTVEAALLYVGIDASYKTIQDAINAANPDDTIIVKNGTYYESVTINKAGLNLIGNSSTDCKIIHYYEGTNDYNDSAAAFNVTATGVTITGFNITVSGNYTFGIHLQYSITSSTNLKIIHNIITTSGCNGYGIYLEYQSNNNNLSENNIFTWNQSGYGIYLNNSSNNNNITNNVIETMGNFSYGIYLYDSGYNNLTYNTINNSGNFGFGIYLQQSSNNNLTTNSVYPNGQNAYGIYLNQSSNNNKLDNNVIQTAGENGRGIYLRESSFNNLTNLEISTTNQNGIGIYIQLNSHNNNLTDSVVQTTGTLGHDIYIDNSNKNTILNCDLSAIDANSNGFILDGSYATIINTSISTSNKDIVAINNGNITAINCSYNTIEVTTGGGGVLQVKNYLTIQAYYEDMVTPIQDADVLVEDNDLSIYNTSGYGGSNIQTDANGRIENITVMDRWYFYNNIATENTTTVKVKKTLGGSWEEVRNNVDMSTSHTETFIATDIVAPAIPTGLKVTQIPGINDLNISWDLNIDNTFNYTIYTNQSGGPWVVLSNITHPTNWTHDEDLLDGSWYYYIIQAWDDSEIPSGLSVPVGCCLIDITPPQPPTSLICNKTGGTYIELAWTDSISMDVEGYEIYMNDTGSTVNYHLLT